MNKLNIQLQDESLNQYYKEKTNYYKNLSSDKKKEYSKRAYEKKKQKLLEDKNI